MYYLIRWSYSNEVAGIMDTGSDILFYTNRGGYGTLIVAIQDHFNTDKHFTWETITRAVYETYRDLYGLEVIECTT